MQQAIKGLSSRFEEADYTLALTQAERDTGWTLPQTDGTKITWLKKRTTRHLYSALRSESAHKFKFEGINLQNRFEHYSDLVKEMDKEWDDEKDSLFLLDNKRFVAGVKIDAGFQYGRYTGRDLTYNYDNRTIITPDDSE